MSRVAAIVFDSPDVDMLARELAAGRLPNLAGLLERGQTVLLREDQELLTSPAAPTLTHGCDPGGHQLVFWLQLQPGTYRLAPVPAEAVARPPFWKHLGEAGKRCVIVSPYAAGFVEGLHGTQVIGWGTHDPYSHGRWRSDPAGLARELERRFGPRTLHVGEPPPAGPDGARDYIERMLRGVRQQAEALTSLMHSEEWDFFLGFICEGHQAGHYIWHLANPGGDHPEPAEPALRDGLAAIYRAIDAGIGRIVEAAPEEATVMVASGTSMGPHHGLGQAVEPVLERAGWLERGGAGAAPPRQRALGLARRAVRAAVPARMRPALGRLVPRDRLVAELTLAEVDWSHTRAFQIPSDGSAAIRLNLAGREPQGKVQPGGGYDSACAELIALFESLRVAETGEPAVARAARFDELVGTPAVGPLPDICVRWARLRDVHALTAPELGVVEFPRTDPRTSLHWEPGFLVMAGPEIAPSGRAGLDGPDARIVDFAATVLDRLGVAQPAALMGAPIGLQPAP